MVTLGRSELRCNQVDLTSLAHIIAYRTATRRPWPACGIHHPDGISASGDAEMLRIVMQNLIGNAWRFTGLVDFARIELGVTYPAGKPTEYFVRDNGGGFDMKYADRLFGAFQRLHLAEEFPGPVSDWPL